MCYYDPDGGFIDDTDNVYGDDIEATKYDIRRKQREELELDKECDEDDTQGCSVEGCYVEEGS